MFLFFSYNSFSLIVVFLVLLCFSLPCFPARLLPGTLTELTAEPTSQNGNGSNTWHDFARFIDAGRGSQVSGISELKKYFQRFGYLESANLTDAFDDGLESAVVSYQRNLGLEVTGKLNARTVSEIVLPRCGVSDSGHGKAHIHATRRYAYFSGEPRWGRPAPMRLTYAFSPGNMIGYIPMSEIRSVFQRAFSRWSAVIPVSFTEVDDYGSADVKIGFYKGDHGDGESFDGVLGILAHAFSPENGRFHLDAAETWAVDFGSEKSKVAIDLESVATHEIGHILGLAHSSVKEAVMYPSLSPRSKKVDLRIDDVEGVQALYGSNPNFSINSLLESEKSLSWAVRLGTRTSASVFFLALTITLCLL